MDSNPYQPSTHPSSTYNMQAPSQDHTRHVGHRDVVHDSTVSLPVALGSQQVRLHANVAAVMHPFALITRCQEMPGHARAPNGSMHLPSISALYYDSNQLGGEPAPPYAVHHQPVYPSNEQQERVAPPISILTTALRDRL
ncbi:hypothetical protein M408DRAFT_117686 [Serendipita vermifera MAFF 305830]|uniref:Uncharacterized protein n=1 Tax=Serendipita vermifera MAFF 305830 TaxID=933852 RepID=A0A0C3A8L9_SERVB|nr:hypothetical protein M408DRAFT_117686 [Serendipita vermifera MAFF 305830]